MYFTINTITELSCLLIAVFCLFRDKDSTWRMLIIYLFLTVLTEMLGIHYAKVLHQSNVWIYNIFISIECFTISYFFYQLFKPYGLQLKWLINWLVVFFMILSYELLTKNFTRFASNTATIISIVFVFAALIYFYKKLTDEKFEQLTVYAPFWWVSGTLFFYFGSTCCNLLFDYLTVQTSRVYGISVNYLIFNILNIILYLLWSYAFICRYLRRKSLYTSSSPR
ncbi:hypothetical protein [Pedobacter alpinus]|uniref:Nicotinamide mononucleotide transporter n=1 Tax=Pedobacter alpinus TaxID=1590643 RepID=A0ABW5TT76_9SPHI